MGFQVSAELVGQHLRQGRSLEFLVQLFETARLRDVIDGEETRFCDERKVLPEAPDRFRAKKVVRHKICVWSAEHRRPGNDVEINEGRGRCHGSSILLNGPPASTC